MQEQVIGSFNPDLEHASPNGTMTALQAKLPNRYECSFNVTVQDVELPQCGAYEAYQTYSVADGSDVETGGCISSILTIDEAYTIADLNIH